MPYDVTAKKNWVDKAQCAGTTSNIFFPDKKLPIDDKFRLNQAAKAICKECDVIDECLAYAVENPFLVSDGTWGGKTYKEIKRIRRRRGV